MEVQSIICGACGSVIAAKEGAPCGDCGVDPILEGRYRLEAVIGQGAMGITYRGVRLSDGVEVAVKELPFRRIDSMKTKALFEREAKVLRQLDHEGVPSYLDDFVSGSGKSLSLFVVQELIRGTTLAEEMRDVRYSEVEVLAILRDVLEILVYLHTLAPPVIHRDIKPQNVMRREGGGLVLIDFGAVRDVIKDSKLGGSTVVGTFGYMAPEQFQGIAVPATDLYALGATAVELLARKSPDTMLDYNGELHWEKFVDVSGGCVGLLTTMLTRDHEQRASSAARLLTQIEALLEGDDVDEDEGAPASEAAMPPQPELFDLAVNDPPPPPLMPSSLESYAGDQDEFFRSAPQEAKADDASSSASTKLIFSALAAILAVSVLFVVLAQNAPSGGGDVKGWSKPAERCGENPCPPVSRGLKGLEFGMTRTEVEAKWPEVSGLSTEKGEQVGTFDIYNLGSISKRARVEGFGINVTGTTYGGFPAACKLDFTGGAHKLSRMTCTLESFSSETTHRHAEETLLLALTDHLGPPTTTHTPEDVHIMGVKHEGQWDWSDDGATLELYAKVETNTMMPGDMANRTRSEIKVTNSSPEYDAAVRRADERERVRKAEAAREKRAEDAKKRAEELERIKNAREGNAADDL